MITWSALQGGVVTVHKRTALCAEVETAGLPKYGLLEQHRRVAAAHAHNRHAAAGSAREVGIERAARQRHRRSEAVHGAAQAAEVGEDALCMAPMHGSPPRHHLGC